MRGARWVLGREAAKEATTNGRQEILTGILTIVPAVKKGKTRYDHRPTLQYLEHIWEAILWSYSESFSSHF